MIYYDYYENIPTIYGVDPTPCVASLPTGTMNIVLVKYEGLKVIWCFALNWYDDQM